MTLLSPKAGVCVNASLGSLHRYISLFDIEIAFDLSKQNKI